MRRFQGVLLDVDGTLVDTVKAHALAWREAFADHDYEVELVKIERLIGMGSDHLVKLLTGIEKDSRAFTQLTKAQEKHFDAKRPRQFGIVGARDFVQQLRTKGYEVAVASSAKGDKLDALLDLANVRELLPERAGANQVKHSKPDPDVIEAALALLPVAPRQTVMIGDTPYDIEAASRAGVATIGVATGVFAVEELVGAIAVYASISDLLAHWDESPLA